MYMAPEIIKTNNDDCVPISGAEMEKADIWSLGIFSSFRVICIDLIFFVRVSWTYVIPMRSYVMKLVSLSQLLLKNHSQMDFSNFIQEAKAPCCALSDEARIRKHRSQILAYLVCKHVFF